MVPCTYSPNVSFYRFFCNLTQESRTHGYCFFYNFTRNCLNLEIKQYYYLLEIQNIHFQSFKSRTFIDFLHGLTLHYVIYYLRVKIKKKKRSPIAVDEQKFSDLLLSLQLFLPLSPSLSLFPSISLDILGYHRKLLPFIIIIIIKTSVRLQLQDWTRKSLVTFTGSSANSS